MKAGFGKEQIFIKKKLELTGFKRGRISNKTLDGIFCRAILLEDKKKSKILFLSIDLLFIGRSLSNKIKEKIKLLYNISEENICITATHTHSVPKTCENFLDGIAVNKSFFNAVLEKSCKAVSLAFKFKKSAIAQIFQISDYPAINRRLPVPLALKLFPNYFRRYCINRPNKKVASDKLLLKVDNISRDYQDNSFKFFGKRSSFNAVRNVSFSINYNENVGLVGESGCGKSTITRAILGLDPISNGKIFLENDEIRSEKVDNKIRKKVQVVFQDPFGSFNPRHNVLKLVSEPLYLDNLKISDTQKLDMVKALLQRVGLKSSDHKKFIHEFSGGQRQRIAIARSLILKPKLIILDEAVSALDVSIRAQILDLLVELSESFGLSYLFISHDLSLVKSITSRVLVMKSGEIVEAGNTKEIFNSPTHQYTKNLLESSPNLENAIRNL